MDARFRIRTRDGREMTPRTVEIFSDLVRSGVVRPDDLVHDAFRGDWVPAASHPMVRLFQDPLVVDPLSPSLEARLAEEARDAAVTASSGELKGVEDLSELALVDVPVPDPEMEAQAFIQRMEEERRSDPDRALLEEEITLESSGGRALAFPEDPSPPIPSRTAEPEPRFRTDIARDVWADRTTLGGPPPAPVWRKRRHLGGRGGLVAAAMALTLLGGLLALGWGPSLLSGAAEEDGVARAAMAAPSVPRGLPASEEQVRESAFRGFLAQVDAVRDTQGLGEVPSEWLEGRYLSDAEAYPEVREYFRGALRYVDAVEGQERELYRAAYLAAAEEAGISGPVRSLRLATALEDFTREAPARAVHYQRMRELADAALALHDVMVTLGDRVTYEPIRGRDVSADPVLEAAGADPEAQALLEVALDRVLAAMTRSDGTGAGARDQVSSWLVQGLAER